MSPIVEKYFGFLMDFVFVLHEDRLKIRQENLGNERVRKLMDWILMRLSIYEKHETLMKWDKREKTKHQAKMVFDYFLDSKDTNTGNNKCHNPFRNSNNSP